MGMRRFVTAVLVCLAASANAFAQSGYGKYLSFAGYTWRVKVSTGKVGPGPNFFSENNVWVDTTTDPLHPTLHLKISRSGSKWLCAELVLQNTLGYGTYAFDVGSPLDKLDPNVVLGLFTWNDAPDYNHRELDIEFAKWGNAGGNNVWYTVQPYNVAGNQASSLQPANTPESVHTLDWFTNTAQTMQTAHFFSQTNGVTYFDRVFTSGVPPTGGENVRMNLWLFGGRAPKAPVEIVVKDFRFTKH
jgi:hypothetical protein